MYSVKDLWFFTIGVSPFGNLRLITDISSLPQLIAGNRVLLRLSVPRHSPYALVRLNFLLLFVLFEWSEFHLNMVITLREKAFLAFF